MIQLEKDGSVVIEEITDDDISFYALYGDLYETSFFDLNANPLVNTISPDIEFEPSDTVDTATSSTKRSVRRVNTTHLEDTGRLETRELPLNAVFEIGKIEGDVGFPFHLRWLNSLWAKNAWEGECESFRLYSAAAAGTAMMSSPSRAFAWTFSLLD